MPADGSHLPCDVTRKGDVEGYMFHVMYRTGYGKGSMVISWWHWVMYRRKDMRMYRGKDVRGEGACIG